MGTKGSKDTETGRLAAEALVDRLQPLGAVTSKKMFGGYGVFLEGVMFAIVDSSGACFLRATDATSGPYTERGSQRHGRMPYWAIPDTVLADDAALAEWASGAIETATRAK